MTQAANGVVVFQRGQSQPVTGYLVLENDRHVTLRQVLPDGQKRDITIAKEEIEDLIHTVDSARLAALDPAQTQEYREYADELAEKKLDPEARDAAIRLYVTCAWLDPAGQGRGAMLGLVALARSHDEESRFRAAAFLADPRHDPTVLKKPDAAAPAGLPPSDAAARAKLQEAVRHARQGKGEIAGRLAQRPEIRAELERFRAILAPDEFALLCRAKELGGPELGKLLRLEMALEAAAAPQPPPSSARDALRAWSRSLKDPPAALRSLDLEHLTEFNPRECLFRDGKWVER